MIHPPGPPRLTVVLDAEPLLFPHSGIGVYTQQLVQALVRRTGPERWRLSYASRQKARLRRLEAVVCQEFPGVPLHLFRLPGLLVNLLDRHLRPWVRPPLRQPALYHATSFVRPPWGVSLGLPQVLTIHDLAFLTPQPAEYGPPAYTRMLRRRLPHAVLAARAILTMSEFTRSELLRRLGADPAKVFVSPLASPWPPPTPPPEPDHPILTRHGIRPGTYFLSVGVLSPRKNMDVLLDCFAAWQARCPEARLVIVGEPGWACERLVQRLRADLAGVTWIAGCETAELQAWYSHARALFLLSRYEGFGIPVLEAMSCGCPVVHATGSAMDEVAGDAGLAVSPDAREEIRQTMQRLWTDDGLCARLREDGLRRARCFSWDHTARVTLDAYEFAENHRGNA